MASHSGSAAPAAPPAGSAPSVAEILKRVQRIQIVANRTVDDLLAGQYHSVFRGRGMEFDEVREYQPGDDVRTIDWNVTARAGAPFIKRYREERELTVLLLVDVSASGAFGSLRRSKLELMVEVAALLMFSALKNHDKVGLVLFCEEVLRYLPPHKGKGNVLRLIRELISTGPVARPTRLAVALDFLNRVQKRRCVAFLMSDFLGIGEEDQRALSAANGRHDLVAVSVTDPRERTLPDVGFLTLRDAETGEIVELDTGSPRVRALFEQRATERTGRLTDTLRRIGVDELPIGTGEDYLKSLRRFFSMREKRFR
ncbi:MAG: DUF58 domain-containing protein [Planctomycetes bacterium]|nr:DUF58 domain-containing protein [Planctomycetota bacterium]